MITPQQKYTEDVRDLAGLAGHLKEGRERGLQGLVHRALDAALHESHVPRGRAKTGRVDPDDAQSKRTGDGDGVIQYDSPLNIYDDVLAEMEGNVLSTESEP